MTALDREPSVLEAAASLAYAQQCAAGFHAWMPWLPIVTDDGRLQRYETYCVRCRHSEQFDV